jgi:CheY-like chemotaxis protein
MEAEGKVVLVVDDNPGVRELVCMILEDAGLEIETASNGEEALDMAKRIHPDLVILDVMMPGMDGWETAAYLLDEPDTSDIPIIFLTARAKTEEQLRGWEMPIFDYITKPFTADDLLDRVFSVLTAEPESKPDVRDAIRREKLRRLLGLADSR